MAPTDLQLDPTSARGCSRPIRLSRYRLGADSEYVDGGETYVRCRTRREARCPSCAQAYARDARTIIRSGIPEKRKPGQHVAFLTLTAPGREVFGSANHRMTGRTTGRCPCGKAHVKGDPLLGAPVAPRAFRYDRAAAWNAALPELWRRFLIALDRELNPNGAEHFAVSYVKVVEVQRRGLWHIHAVVRFDPLTKHHRPQRQMASAIREAAGSVGWDGHQFGRQMDARFARQRPPRRRSGESEAHHKARVRRTDTVAGFANYLAKYATKGPEHAMSKGVCGPALARHHERLRAAGRTVADEWLRERGAVASRSAAADAKLGVWHDRVRGDIVRNSRANATAEAFGYGGQFLTKARAYGKSFGDLRAEARAVATERYPRGPEDEGWLWSLVDFGYAVQEHHDWAVAFWQAHYKDKGLPPPPEFRPF